ncbi:Rho-binding antiterminator [Vibrio sp. Vb2880]|uniref:Rho-binding antiterminator n=1 Tax=Vibrio sp. Vb2880 TaxID=2816076 RepID=UPI001A8EF9B2|nr:Rho-binding antiterminator [Vibrio sp. Vb2880]MBO0213558.1 Rho-binding antiterminator [Vibrio sp. Vb2880]
MISCSQYDAIELACVYQFPVAVTLLNGDVVQGIAKGTGYNAERQECLVLQQAECERWVATATLRRMQVLIENPHLSDIHFQQQ